MKKRKNGVITSHWSWEETYQAKDIRGIEYKGREEKLETGVKSRAWKWGK